MEESINITEVIFQTINNLFSGLFSSIDNSLYPVLDDITFINTDILTNSPLELLLGSQTQNGILLICNSLLIGIFLYFLISNFVSFYTYSNYQKPLSFFFKLIIYGILMNFCFFFCEQIINLISLISSAIRNSGEVLFNKSICFSSLIDNLNSIISIGKDEFNIFSLDGLIKGFISFGLFQLLFAYSLRYILVKVWILISPFAILSLILNSTSWFFRTWLRSFLAFMLVQIFISFVLLIAFSVNYTDDLLSKLMIVGCIYAFTKANSIVREWMGGISSEVSGGIAGIKSFLKGGLRIMRFIFPQNYQFHSRLLGLFDYTTLIFNIVWFAFLFVCSNLFFDNLEIKIAFCTILDLPFILFSFIGIHGENMFSIIFSMLSFIKKRRIYFYSK